MDFFNRDRKYETDGPEKETGPLKYYSDERRNKMIGVIIVLAIIVFLVFLVAIVCIAIYNNLITLRNRFKNAYSQIDVQLKRRYDLIPNLVETAKGYMKYERGTLEAVISARNQASSANARVAANPADSEAIKNLIGAETALNGALGRLFALAEAYPDLKANQTMSQLMEELSTTENKIAFARQAYNDAVMSYNIGREKFPNTIIAGTFGFREAVLFEISVPEEREAVKVTF
jgi:LemA protein